MKVAELRDLLRERGLAVSGIKAELVGRLTSYEGNDDLAVLADELSSKKQKLPGNLIFANNEDEDDDSWDDEEFDPNQTSLADLPYEQPEKK